MAPSTEISRDKVLHPSEVRRVLDELHRKARRSKLTKRNLVLFRLATCCGLRVGEICGLTLDDIRLGVRPTIRIRKENTKATKADKKRPGKRKAVGRSVPLHWDHGTLQDITEWKQLRKSEGATGSDFFLITGKNTPLNRINARASFISVCKKVLGRDDITIHHGRHTFISMALHGNRNIVSVRDAAGHSSLGTTSLYSHMFEDESNEVGNLFG